MKIVTSESVYIQKRDISLLRRGYLLLPISLIDKIGSLDIDKTTEEQYLSFDTPHEVFFINSLNCLINYSDVINLSIEELERLTRKLLLEKDSLEIEENQNKELNWNLLVINHKLQTINMIIECKKKGLKVPLPEDLGDQNRPIDGIKPNGFVKKIGRI